MEPNEMKPFWMVYGVGQRGPSYRHDTEDSATREAERLAEISPGTTFVVLEATQAVRLRKFDRVDLRARTSADGGLRPAGLPGGDEHDPIPF